MTTYGQCEACGGIINLADNGEGDGIYVEVGGGGVWKVCPTCANATTLGFHVPSRPWYGAKTVPVCHECASVVERDTCPEIARADAASYVCDRCERPVSECAIVLAEAEEGKTP